MSAEMLDVIDENDRVTDKQPRAIVHQLGLWHRGAHVFLFTEDGKLLVQKRSAARAQSPSLLDCSVSEHVKAGETYLEAAHRGLREEMGVEGIALKEVAKFRMNYGINDNEISVLYEGIVDSARVKFDPVEVASVRYFGVEELKSMLENESHNLCGWFAEILNLYFYGSGKMDVFHFKNPHQEETH